MFLCLLAIVFGAWMVLIIWKGRMMKTRAKQFPNDIQAWPFIGHMYHWVGSDEDRMEAFKKFGREAIKQGGMSHMWLGNDFYIMLCDPAAAEVLLKACLEKDQRTMKFTRVLTGDGLIFAPVNIWRPRRKMLAPMFSQKNLNSFVQVFAKQSAVLVQQLQPAADGTDFSIWKYITTYTFDSVGETTIGIQMNTQKQKSHPFLDAFDDICAIVAQRMMQPWLHPDFVFRLLPLFRRTEANKQILHGFADKIIQARRQELAKKGKEESEILNKNNDDLNSILDMLIEASGGETGYSDVELREEVLVIILAGTDTSAVGGAFATVMLSRYQEEQAKVYEEIQEVFGDSDRLLQVEDLPKLKYLELFIKETLRLYPPVPVTVRDVHSDVTLPCGKTAEAGTAVLLNIWGMHRNHHYWGEDVEQFCPERFLQPLKHPAQFVPFSYGMRNCIGYQYAMMSMKTVLASLLRRYRVLPPAALAPAQLHKPLRVQFDVMMRHVDNFVVRLEPRH